MPVFVDTGGWFAYFVRRDADPMAAVDWMRQNRQPLVTTDYVLDELFTLLKLRESHRVAAAAGAALLDQSVTRLEWIGDPDFRAAWEVFQHYSDKGWSFTDCTSKVVMQRLSVTHAFAFDSHFEEFGTIVRVPESINS
jgi:predicted nucleic acid-binding protein